MLEMWERIQLEWGKFDQDICLMLIESLSKRIEAVLKAKGKWIKY
jgi:hypothetical protein